MAVSVLNRSGARSRVAAPALPLSVLLVTLLAPATDLLANVQSVLAFEGVSLAVCTGAAGVLALTWARYPHTTWLFAAFVAAAASATLRVAGAELAPLLSLLAVVALGVGGSFAQRGHDLQEMVELQPSVARR